MKKSLLAICLFFSLLTISNAVPVTCEVQYDGGQLETDGHEDMISDWVKRLLEFCGIDIDENQPILCTNIDHALWGSPTLVIIYDGNLKRYDPEDESDMIEIIADIVVECDEYADITPLDDTVIDYED